MTPYRGVWSSKTHYMWTSCSTPARSEWTQTVGSKDGEVGLATQARRPLRQARRSRARCRARPTRPTAAAGAQGRDRPLARRPADRFRPTTLEDRYLLPGESYQDMFARVATAFADDADHAQRIYDYISKLWFMPATPVLSNGGASRGLPISCFLNAVGDSLESIVGTWNQNVWLAANGGGIGTYWGGVRSIGEKVKGSGQTSGIIPFIRVMDSLTLAISQGSLRRGSAAVYVDIHHPGDRGVPRDPQTLGRLQPQVAQPAPRHSRSPTSSWRRCATARRSRCARPRPARWSARSTRATCGRRCWSCACRPASPI